MTSKPVAVDHETMVYYITWNFNSCSIMYWVQVDGDMTNYSKCPWETSKPVAVDHETDGLVLYYDISTPAQLCIGYK